MTPRSHLVGVLVGGTVGLAGCQPLDRTRGLGEGGLRARVVDGAGAGIAGARLSVLGMPRLGTSDSLGDVVVGGLVPGDLAVRVGVDDDGDGVDDRAAIAGVAAIRLAEIGGLIRRTTFDLGDVVVEATGEVAGTVGGVLDGELARVVAFRVLRVGDRDVALPIEAAAGVDVDGAFVLRGLVPGPVTLVAFVWPKATSTQPLQQQIAASRPTRFARIDVDVGQADVALDVATAVPLSVPVTLTLGGVLAPDRNDGLADFLVPHTTTPVAPTLTAPLAGLTEDTATLAVSAPLSVFDLAVQLDSGAAGTASLLIALPDTALLPVAIGLDVACPTLDGVDGTSDCDGDGVEDGVDEDADGDGVIDAIEPAACVGVGRGVDDDADCLCGLADPFPGCASNDPLDCTPAAPIDCD